jgi:peroxiredoxin
MIVLLAAVTALLSVLLGAVCWTLYGLLRQNGRLLLRIEALEAASADTGKSAPSGRVFADRSLARSRIERAGLAPGTAAPDFRLPTIDGREAALADYTGRWLLLVFTDPECAPCLAMLPRLERAARASQVSVLLISRRDADANRRKLADAGVTLRVALQQQWEISRLYAKFATPIAYLVDPRGRIAEDVAMGADAILALLSNRTHTHARPMGGDGSSRPVVH